MLMGKFKFHTLKEIKSAIKGRFRIVGKSGDKYRSMEEIKLECITCGNSLAKNGVDPLKQKACELIGQSIGCPSCKKVQAISEEVIRAKLKKDNFLLLSSFYKIKQKVTIKCLKCNLFLKDISIHDYWYFGRRLPCFCNSLPNEMFEQFIRLKFNGIRGGRKFNNADYMLQKGKKIILIECKFGNSALNTNLSRFRKSAEVQHKKYVNLASKNPNIKIIYLNCSFKTLTIEKSQKINYYDLVNFNSVKVFNQKFNQKDLDFLVNLLESPSLSRDQFNKKKREIQKSFLKLAKENNYTLPTLAQINKKLFVNYNEVYDAFSIFKKSERTFENLACQISKGRKKPILTLDNRRILNLEETARLISEGFAKRHKLDVIELKMKGKQRYAILQCKNNHARLELRVEKLKTKKRGCVACKRLEIETFLTQNDLVIYPSFTVVNKKYTFTCLKCEHSRRTRYSELEVQSKKYGYICTHCKNKIKISL